MQERTQTKYLLLAPSVLLTIAVALTPFALAQNRPKPQSKPQSNPKTSDTIAAPQFISVQVVHVKPEMLTEFQEFARTQTLPAYQKAGIKERTAWTTAVFGEAYEYVFVTPIDSMSQYDGPSPVVRALGEDGARAYGEKSRRLIASSRTICLQVRPDLSIEPKLTGPPRLGTGTVVSIAPGRAQDFEALFKNDLLPVLRKAELQGLLLAQGSLGGDPYEYHIFALYDSFAEIGKGSPYVRVLGPAGANLLLKKGAGIVTKVERTVYRFVPDLSITPSMQKAENK